MRTGEYIDAVIQGARDRNIEVTKITCTFPGFKNLCVTGRWIDRRTPIGVAVITNRTDDWEKPDVVRLVDGLERRITERGRKG